MGVQFAPPVPMSPVGYVYFITVSVAPNTEVPVKNQSVANDVFRTLGLF